MSQSIYFGTYTKKESKGIYKAQFDPETGNLSDLELVAAEPNPTFIAFSEKGNLYSVGAQDGKGGIASFTADFQPLNHVVEEGAPLCYVSVDDKRQLVYGANYHKGQVLVYKIEGDGQLSLIDQDTHEGKGPHENQASPHVHFADLTPDQYLITCDLGTDSLHTYEVSDQGKLTLLHHYQTAPGAGPRHLVFHPHHKIAYLINELNATIDVLFYDGMGEFEHFQTVSTLPEDYDGQKWASAIKHSADGKFLYASNRAHNSIAVFEVIADGSLKLIEIVPTDGLNPRDFTLSPDQHYLIAAHQDSPNATVFKRDPETGRLSSLSHDFYVPEAVCTVFH
ncbi:lactonase family protein [Streptococcus sp. IMAU 99161]|uniref:lactonase family protein n=1 Tax=Streptococcus sp. IMAU 99161 TaxID=2710601 RepID=UPI001654C52A|nr:lactonase family protein [Streptococcus sp. IMAU 99161]MBC8776353.1 lactonase family protein [Streptococcus sp. IMAU 99161]